MFPVLQVFSSILLRTIMNYTQDFDVFNFPFWSGALDRVKDLDCSELAALGEYIEECFADTTPTKTQINDFVWFECDDFIGELTNKVY